MQTRHATVPTTLGTLTLVAEGDALIGLYFPHHWYAPDPATFGPRVDAEDDALLCRAAAQVGEYLAGERRDFDVPIAPRGDDFQNLVWDLVAEIGYGDVRTYGDLAAELVAAVGDRSLEDLPLARMVGQAVGRNPLCLFVPCHRVVGAGGRITGYAGGRDRKRRLLELEEPSLVAAGRLF